MPAGERRSYGPKKKLLVPGMGQCAERVVVSPGNKRAIHQRSLHLFREEGNAPEEWLSHPGKEYA